jgi:hypothetical protein
VGGLCRPPSLARSFEEILQVGLKGFCGWDSFTGISGEKGRGVFKGGGGR